MPRMASIAGRLRSHHAGLLYLLIASVGWGLNWPTLKIILGEWPPLSARGASGVAAALGLAVLAAASGERLAVPRRLLGRVVLAAITNVLVWMGFTTVAMLWLNVGEAALIVYTMPIWVTLLAWPVLGERPTARTIAALALGIAGIGVLLGGQIDAIGPQKWAGVLLALSAAVLFALGTVTTRSALPLPPLASVAWQVGLGCAPMLAAGLLFERPEVGALSAAGWAGMLYMTVVPMGVSYVCWFAALRRLPAATASIGTLLVPLVGVATAAYALGEPFGLKEILALVLTLGGVALALRKA
jgi:drug/metabolite transporter (DMT)-like permease